jgi:hypothetical protein
MGTSSSYSGPSGRPPLLPPWALDPLPLPLPTPPNPDELDNSPSETPSIPFPAPPIPSISWRSPRQAMGKLASGNGDIGKCSRSYVSASGGASGIASSAVSGRRSTTKLGGFFSNVASSGFTVAAEKLGLTNLVGLNVNAILAALIRVLAPDGAMREEAIARKAIIETLVTVFEKFDVGNQGIEALNAISPEGVLEILCTSITDYVDIRMQEELINRVERGAISEHDANMYADQIKGFIDANIQLDLSGMDVLRMDWDGAEGKEFIDRQYERAYRLLGGE